MTQRRSCIYLYVPLNCWKKCKEKADSYLLRMYLCTNFLYFTLNASLNTLFLSKYLLYLYHLSYSGFNTQAENALFPSFVVGFRSNRAHCLSKLRKMTRRSAVTLSAKASTTKPVGASPPRDLRNWMISLRRACAKRDSSSWLALAAAEAS